MEEYLAILGSTGSIGKSTLEVVAQHPEKYRVLALTGGTNVSEIIAQVKRFQPEIVSMLSKHFAEQVKRKIADCIPVYWGEEGLLAAATYKKITCVVSALVGMVGLRPTLAAIQAKKKIALANKETLVVGGHLIMQEVEKNQVSLLPIDSEHSAIFQCLQGERDKNIRRIFLTASGGAFREWSRKSLNYATVEQALQHPTWQMGRKITIDSATMVNKGLEVIEAHWLFRLPYENIEVLLHPQSTVHGLVEFQDGSVKAQVGNPDMKVPIQYALTYPDRAKLHTPFLNTKLEMRWEFSSVDIVRYPCLGMAYEAGKKGGTMPVVFNAANEEAVEIFLSGNCPFLFIEEILEHALYHHKSISNPNLEEIAYVDEWARTFVREWSKKQLGKKNIKISDGGV